MFLWGAAFGPINKARNTTQGAHNAANFLESERIEAVDQMYPINDAYCFVLLDIVLVMLSVISKAMWSVYQKT